MTAVLRTSQNRSSAKDRQQLHQVAKDAADILFPDKKEKQ